MDSNKFLYIKEKYGHQSSWAIWNDKMSDLSMFDTIDNIQINNKIVLVGLNISKKIENPFGNFHSGKNDYKLRYSLQNTILSGAYMTDIIKDYEQKISGKVMKFLKENPTFVQENINSFKNEINDIGCEKPVLIAFGNDAYKLLIDNLHDYKIYKVTHYSAFINQYKLKEEFEKIISELNK
jgi:hypothetical protein